MTFQIEEEALVVPFEGYEKSTSLLLDNLNLKELIKAMKKIIVKPNLVSCAPPPVTTDVRIVEEICKYCLKNSSARIIVAEGPASCDASKTFKELGFEKRLKSLGVELIDIDAQTEIQKLQNNNMPLLKEIYLPKVITDGFLISVPALKDHTFCTTTLSIKNLIGFLPAKHYKGFWRFRKSKAHRYNIHQAVADVASHRPINLAIIDGVIGLRKSHLIGGKPCKPPKKLLVGSTDPLAADIEGTKILGHNPVGVKHLRCFNNNRKQVPRKQKPNVLP